MIELVGKYNKAHVMIDEIDETTLKQLLELLNQESFSDTYIAIMPDCHAGKGSVIGFTMKLNNYVIPNIIGVDQGCGMLTCRFDKHNVDLPSFDNFIKNEIPAGFNINKTNNIKNTVIINDISDVCKIINIDKDRVFNSIGTLGGGNHFIEAGYDKNNNFTVTIHTGSRNFGKCIAEFYQNKAKEYIIDNNISGIQKGLEYLPVDSINGKEYLKSLRIGQMFARINRLEILNRISNYLNCNYSEKIESVHNFIDSDNIIRKGATPAYNGQYVIIPFNMADGIALCYGKGSSKYNYSAPHGAGRILSRAKAKETINLEDYKKVMENANVYSSCINKTTLDESPMAYKDKNLIIENIKETVDIIEFIKPVYNFKSSGE